MAASKTQICNMALAHCAVSLRVTDIDNLTDTSAEAEQCRLFYDHCLDLLLENRAWGFATRRVALQVLSMPDEYTDFWSYRYAYPNFCKRINRIVNPYIRNERTKEERVPFETIDRDDSDGRAILCDLEDAVLEYNHLITDATRYPTTFIQALALMLAAHIAMPLRADDKIIASLDRRVAMWLGEAVGVGWNEHRPTEQPESQFVVARR